MSLNHYYAMQPSQNMMKILLEQVNREKAKPILGLFGTHIFTPRWLTSFANMGLSKA